ncbi:uncharacterized protein B0H18DRAFT_358363 [Fomitopsis serialis]|uniref:uncharacterized protein n=1 Tax=Fomitopsis serialis TaxID=139415 RepID=UPI0020088A0B|nr:uncharacterized protein B0H18DRAFT_358363 [Neoantrodia serialis]KAH9911491.1 hypothetical protein B0H18DRAFT_358363 [Neoantrodia serialis]
MVAVGSLIPCLRKPGRAPRTGRSIRPPVKAILDPGSFRLSASTRLLRVLSADIPATDCLENPSHGLHARSDLSLFPPARVEVGVHYPPSGSTCKRPPNTVLRDCRTRHRTREGSLGSRSTLLAGTTVRAPSAVTCSSSVEVSPRRRVPSVVCSRSSTSSPRATISRLSAFSGSLNSPRCFQQGTSLNPAVVALALARPSLLSAALRSPSFLPCWVLRSLSRTSAQSASARSRS